MARAIEDSPTNPPSGRTPVIGIDPGVNGGIALIPREGPSTAWRMPGEEEDICDLIVSLGDENPGVVAFIEKVNAFKNASRSSSFKFGQGYGFLRGCLVGRVPFEQTYPRAWMQAARCLSGGDKRLTRLLAQNRHPHIKVTNCTSEALLIAEAGVIILRKRRDVEESIAARAAEIRKESYR